MRHSLMHGSLGTNSNFWERIRLSRKTLHGEKNLKFLTEFN